MEYLAVLSSEEATHPSTTKQGHQVVQLSLLSSKAALYSSASAFNKRIFPLLSAKSQSNSKLQVPFISVFMSYCSRVPSVKFNFARAFFRMRLPSKTGDLNVKACSFNLKASLCQS